jgi:taurine dioxygenase
MQSRQLELQLVSPHCGALVQGVDLALRLDPSLVGALAEALGRHGVLFFRDQELTPERLKTLGRSFGELHLHPTWPRLVEGHPEIMEIYADENSTRIAGEQWHSDVSCDPRPPLGSILYMLETPPVGGDTLFANMYTAFEALSPAMQGFLVGLSAVHDGEQVYRRGYGAKPKVDSGYPRAVHPVIRTHPLSGRRALFVNRTFTTHIEGLARWESEALLNMLFAHAEQPLFQCRFSWRPGSVAFWDNRCAQHHALWDYFPNRRRAWRVTVKGEMPL